MIAGSYIYQNIGTIIAISMQHQVVLFFVHGAFASDAKNSFALN